MRFYTILSSLFATLLVGVWAQSTSPPGFQANQVQSVQSVHPDQSDQSDQPFQADDGFTITRPFLVEIVSLMDYYQPGCIFQAEYQISKVEQTWYESKDWVPPPLKNRNRFENYNSQLFEINNLGYKDSHIDPGRNI